MKKITKKEFSALFDNSRACSLVGAPWGWTLEKIGFRLDAFPAGSIKYNERGHILCGRHAEKITPQKIVFLLHDNKDYSTLTLTNGAFYVHECAAGMFAIAYFDNGEECRNNACIYAMSETGV